jgi:hypothetical protein
MKQTQDSRHYSSSEVTSKKFKVLRQGNFCNIFYSVVQSRSTEYTTNIKSIRLLNMGI